QAALQENLCRHCRILYCAQRPPGCALYSSLYRAQRPFGLCAPILLFTAHNAPSGCAPLFFFYRAQRPSGLCASTSEFSLGRITFRAGWRRVVLYSTSVVILRPIIRVRFRKRRKYERSAVPIASFPTYSLASVGLGSWSQRRDRDRTAGYSRGGCT